MWRKKKQTSSTHDNQHSHLDDTQSLEPPRLPYLPKAISVDSLPLRLPYYKPSNQSQGQNDAGLGDASTSIFTSRTSSSQPSARNNTTRKDTSTQPRAHTSHVRTSQPFPSHDSEVPTKSLPDAPLVLAVVGTTKIGKSTLIRMGLQNFAAHQPTGSAASQEELQIPCHSTHFSVEDETLPVNVVEIDESKFDKKSDPPEFPKGVGQVDGGLLCYDVTERDTMDCLPDLLNAFHSRKIPTYLLGLKTDKADYRQVDADLGHKLASLFGIRHVEANATTEDGVRRMKDAFASLTKSCSRKRVERRQTVGAMNAAGTATPTSETPTSEKRVETEAKTSKVILYEHMEDEGEEDESLYKLPKSRNDAFGAKGLLFDAFKEYDIRGASVTSTETCGNERTYDNEASHPSAILPSISRITSPSTSRIASPSTSRIPSPSTSRLPSPSTSTTLLSLTTPPPPPTSRTPRKLHRVLSVPSLPAASSSYMLISPPTPTTSQSTTRHSPSFSFSTSTRHRRSLPSPTVSKPPPPLSPKLPIVIDSIDSDSDPNEYAFPNSKASSRKRLSAPSHENDLAFPNRPSPRRGSVASHEGESGNDAAFRSSRAALRRGSAASHESEGTEFPNSKIALKRGSITSHESEGHDTRRESLGVPVAGLMCRRGSKDSADSFGTGMTIDDLMDKLLVTETVKNDEHFVTVFLIFYRRFMRPRELMKKLITRFEEEEQKMETEPLPTAVQMKIHLVLVHWLTNHWNDFSNSRTRNLFISFLEGISKHPELTYIYDELAPLIIREPPTDDRDLRWALADLEFEEITSTASRPSSLPPKEEKDEEKEKEEEEGKKKDEKTEKEKEKEKEKGKKDSGYSSAAFDLTSFYETAKFLRTDSQSSLSESLMSSETRTHSSSKSLSLPPMKPTPSTPTTSTFIPPAPTQKRRSSIAAIMPVSISTGTTTPTAPIFVGGPRQHLPKPPEAEFGGGVIVVQPKAKLGRSLVVSSATSIMGTLASKERNLRETEFKALMEMTEMAIAQQLTWVEAELFGRIKPRDYVRHIWTSKSNARSSSSAPSAPSTPSTPNFTSNTNCCVAIGTPPCSIASSISHFNFVSAWVSTMIVTQGKLSRRAKVLEKFMLVALALRNMNNYNTLMAILAGINSAPIMRLKNTRDLTIVKKMDKPFRSLERLMGSDKSFSTYRLALKNSEPPGIPYLGIHLQDLLSLVEGNRDFRSDGAVHWDKFRLMGETIINLRQFQSRPYGWTSDTNVLNFITDTHILSEDQLYERSLEVEPRGSRMSGSANKLKELLLKP